MLASKSFIFPVSFKPEDVLVRLYAKDKELETINKLSVTDKYLRCCDCYSGAAAKNERYNASATTSKQFD